EPQPARRLIIIGDVNLIPAQRIWRSGDVSGCRHGHEKWLAIRQSSRDIHPPMHTSERKPAPRAAGLDGRLELILPTSGASKVDILVGMLKIVAIEKANPQSRASQCPFRKIDARAVFEFPINSVVYKQQCKVCFRIDLDSPGQARAIPPIAECGAGISNALRHSFVVSLRKRSLSGVKTCPHPLGPSQVADLGDGLLFALAAKHRLFPLHERLASNLLRSVFGDLNTGWVRPPTPGVTEVEILA